MGNWNTGRIMRGPALPRSQTEKLIFHLSPHAITHALINVPKKPHPNNTVGQF